MILVFTLLMKVYLQPTVSSGWSMLMIRGVFVRQLSVEPKDEHPLHYGLLFDPVGTVVISGRSMFSNTRDPFDDKRPYVHASKSEQIRVHLCAGDGRYMYAHQGYEQFRYLHPTFLILHLGLHRCQLHSVGATLS